MDIIKISSVEVSKHISQSLDNIKNVSVKVPVSTDSGFISAYSDVKTQKTVNLINAVINSGIDELADASMLTFLHNIRRALAVGYAVQEIYEKSTELSSLKEKNKDNNLLGSDLQLFKELQRSSAIIFGFTVSSYMLYAVKSENKNDEIVKIDWENTQKTRETVLASVYEVVSSFKNSGKFDEALGRVVGVFKAVVQNVHILEHKHMEHFLSKHYKIENEDFAVNGFELNVKVNAAPKLEMTFRKPEEVVGNHIAKQNSLRLVKMLMAYDMETKKSPFVELGGFISTFIGDGNPGTGKTTLIQMMAGLLNDYCKVAGYEFRYRNFGVDELSEYQGVSGRNCKSFTEYVLDPSVIGFGTIDDIDQVTSRRDDKQASGAKQEVTAVLMGVFAGTGTVWRGNTTFGMYSNYPEKVDDALRQRAGARFLVDGPKTLEDYRDLTAILLGKKNIASLGLGEAEGQLFLTQQIQKAVAKSYASHNRPHEKKLEDVYDRCVSELGDLNDIHKISVYLKKIQELDDRFTGRAIKNIMDSVKNRLMDFEIPNEWMENPEVFMWKKFEEKMQMIQSLMQPISHEIVLQEINRYADSELRYSNKSDEAEINNMVRHMGLSSEAQKRFQNKI